MGKCNPWTKIVHASFAWAVLLSATAIFFAFPCRYLMTVYTIGIPILQSIITIFVIVNFALATFVNPGVIPKAKPEEIKGDSVVTPTFQDIEIRGIRVRLKWCVSCQFYRPPRCVHCGVCDTCIETFDHHCPWVNNCIGRRNYRYFFMFLLWLSIHMISILSLCGFYMRDHLNNIQELQTIMTLAIIGIIVILFIPIIGLTAFHMMLIIQGRTTNEQITGKFHDVKSPYTRGCCKNIMYSLCSSPLPRFKPDKSFYSLSNQYTARNTNEHYLKETPTSSSGKSPGVHFKYTDKPDYMLPKQSLSDDCEEAPPSYLNRGRLHLSLSESIYTRPESSNRNKGSRALTPPVPIRFDCSRRSLPPHNRLHVPSPHYVVTQSVHSPVFAKDQSKISACTSSQPSSNNVLYYSHYQDPSLVKYDYGTSAGDACGPASNFYSQLYKKKETFGKPEGISFTSPDLVNSIKTVTSDTCCLGNQTVDKIQEIANRTMISGQCTDVSVLEAFPKGCGSFHNSPNKEHHDGHQLLIAQTPQQLFVNNCVDCQQTSSNHSCQSSISGEFARTPGNRPLSFVRAMEMSEALEWHEPVDIEPGSLQNRMPVTSPLAKVAPHEAQSYRLSPSSTSVPEHKPKKNENEVSYEISV